MENERHEMEEKAAGASGTVTCCVHEIMSRFQSSATTCPVKARASLAYRSNRLLNPRFPLKGRGKLPQCLSSVPTGPSGVARDRVSMSCLSVVADSAAASSAGGDVAVSSSHVPRSQDVSEHLTCRAEIKRFHSSYCADYPAGLNIRR